MPQYEHATVDGSAADRELANVATDFVATHARLPEAGILNPGLMRGAGAVDVNVALVPVTFHSVAAWFEALALDSWMDGLIDHQTVTAERAEAFFSDLATRQRDGMFVAIGIAYIATGRRSS